MSAIIADTPEKIRIFQLLSLKQRLKLEQKGLKARGKSTRTIVANMFGVGKRTSHKKLIAMIEKELDEM